MQMEREFTPEVVDHVLGTYRTSGSEPISRHQRSPLHIEFKHRYTAGDFAPPYDAKDLDDPEEFNAIGSRIQLGEHWHLPVIDVDGGAELQEDESIEGSKLILYAHKNNAPSYQIGLSTVREITDYGPRSLLYDVLKPIGISLEVFDEPVLVTHPEPKVIGKRVTAIVLRSDEKEVFDVVDSTQDGHSHVYLQRILKTPDHRRFITELGNLGIISPAWRKLTLDENQGILRTPWTDKSAAHMPS